MKYRLDVVGASIPDVVEHAGGWLCDRVMAGWEVSVLVADDSDARAVHILGAQRIDLETVLAEGGGGRRPDAVAVAAELCARDPRIRKGLLNAVRDHAVEVVVWGEGSPLDNDRSTDVVLHPLSLAAQAFKAHALSATTHRQITVGRTEAFHSGTSSYRMPAGVDLVPAG